jgi:hypothetical protein
MANSPLLRVRAEPELQAAARAACPELASLGTSALLRAGLLALAGHSVRDAASLATRKRGPKQAT